MAKLDGPRNSHRVRLVIQRREFEAFCASSAALARRPADTLRTVVVAVRVRLCQSVGAESHPVRCAEQLIDLTAAGRSVLAREAMNLLGAVVAQIGMTAPRIDPARAHSALLPLFRRQSTTMNVIAHATDTFRGDQRGEGPLVLRERTRACFVSLLTAY